METTFPNSHVSASICKEIQRYESVHPAIYALYNLIGFIPDDILQENIRDYIIKIESTFVNNQEWTLPRSVKDFKLALLGVEMCGKAALVFRFLTGTYTQEDNNLDGGRYKKEININGHNYLLLIRDEAGEPDQLLAEWLDVVVLVFSLNDLKSFEKICDYYNIINKFRKLNNVPVILVGTQDYLTATNPRSIDEDRINSFIRDFNISGYYETCSMYGLGVHKVFQEACEKILERNQLIFKRAFLLSSSLNSGSEYVSSSQSTNNVKKRHRTQYDSSQPPFSSANHPNTIPNNNVNSLSTAAQQYFHQQRAPPPLVNPLKRISSSPSNNNNNPSPLSRTTHHLLQPDDCCFLTTTTTTNNLNGISSKGGGGGGSEELSNGPTLEAPPPVTPTYVNNPEFKNALAPIIRSQIDKLSQQQNHHQNSLSTCNSNLLSSFPHGSLSQRDNGHYKNVINFYNRFEHSQTTNDLSAVLNSNNNNDEGTTEYFTNSSNKNNQLSSTTPQHSYNFNVKKTKGTFIPYNNTYDFSSTAHNKGTNVNNNNNYQASLPNTAASASTSTMNNYNNNETVGIGRNIPIKQGWLYKKSTKGLNKEWKKKYVTLNKNGILVYHANIQDYMSNENGKNIPLLHTTVKVPGQHQQIQIILSNNNTLHSPSNPNFQNVAPLQGDLMNDSNLNEDFNKISLGPNSSVSQSFIKRLNNNIQQHLTPSSSNNHNNNQQQQFLQGSSSSNTPTNFSASTNDAQACVARTPTSGINSSFNEFAANLVSITTPLTKKKHKRNKSGESGENCEFTIVSLDNKQWHFDAPSLLERQEWVKAIEAQILSGLSDLTSGRNAIAATASTSSTKNFFNSSHGSTTFNSVLTKDTFRSKLTGDGIDSNIPPTHLPQQIVAEKLNYIKTQIPGNGFCVDCRTPNPEWASLNLGALMCIECSGIHRNLGVHISKIRSLQLDDWPSEYLSLLLNIGNDTCNYIYENSIPPGKEKPSTKSTREEKEKWIRAKYETKEFLAPITFKNSIQCSESLLKAVSRQDTANVMLILAYLSVKSQNIPQTLTDNAKDNAVWKHSAEIINRKYQILQMNQPQVFLGKSALHIATMLGNVTILQLLLWNDGDPSIKDNDGHTALDIALKMGHTDCIYVLMKRMQKS